MYIAMNRFRIAPDREEEFEAIPGFKEFHLLRGPGDETATLYASHSVWNSREDFENWTTSEAFRKAHASAGGAKDIYLGPPQFEGFEVVL